jgi:hypothetical protein
VAIVWRPECQQQDRAEPVRLCRPWACVRRNLALKTARAWWENGVSMLSAGVCHKTLVVEEIRAIRAIEEMLADRRVVS